MTKFQELREEIEKGCGKLRNNVYSNPSVFTCGEEIRGKIALCNDCLKKKEKGK